MADKCANCRYVREMQAPPPNLQKVLECHALPPQLIVISAQTLKGVALVPVAAFPNVDPEGWCGAFDQKTPEKIN